MKTLRKFHGPAPVDIQFEPSPNNPYQLLRVQRRSDVTGEINQMDLPITEAQLVAWLGTEEVRGQLIQNAMPHLTNEQREFLISGCSPEEWAKLTRDEE